LFDKFSWSICIPSSCRPTDVENMLRSNFNSVISVDPLTCHIKQHVPFTSTEWTALGIIIIFAVIVIISTVYDLTMTANWKHLFLTNGALQMDIYFVLSGMLLSYLFLRERELGKQFSLWRFYLYRYLRVTPALSIIVLVNATLFNRLGSGPIWEQNILNKQDDCWYYGWTLLFFIRNYTKPHCLFQSWALNIDMQMYLISPLFLIPLHRKPKIGLVMLTVGVIAGMVSVFTTATINRIPVYSFRNMELRMVKELYIQTHTHVTPYLIGLGLGYVLHHYKRCEKLQQQIVFTKLNVTLGWIFCILALTSSNLMALPFLQFNYKYEPLYSSIVLAIKRPIWSLGLSWLIFACVAGYGGFSVTGLLNSFLSCNMFLLLSRFAYGTTVVHSTVVQSRAYSIKTNTYFSDFQQTAD
ncbi:hypothetical protein L9F63_004488, partial [Diploptera punctata]